MVPILKVKLSHYRPAQALVIPGGWGSRISWQLVHEGGSVVSSTPAAFTYQEIILVLISVRGWVDPRATVRPEVLSRLKIPVTSPGREPATFCPVPPPRRPSLLCNEGYFLQFWYPPLTDPWLHVKTMLKLDFLSMCVFCYYSLPFLFPFAFVFLHSPYFCFFSAIRHFCLPYSFSPSFFFYSLVFQVWFVFTFLSLSCVHLLSFLPVSLWLN